MKSISQVVLALQVASSHGIRVSGGVAIDGAVAVHPQSLAAIDTSVLEPIGEGSLARVYNVKGLALMSRLIEGLNFLLKFLSGWSHCSIIFWNTVRGPPLHSFRQFPKSASSA